VRSGTPADADTKNHKNPVDEFAFVTKDPLPFADDLRGFSTRDVAPPYPVGSQHCRIAQPWDLKRGVCFDVLREPGKTKVRKVVKESATTVIAPDCKTLSRARDILIPGARFQPPRLRSEEFPLGLPGLSDHSRKRVEEGNTMFEQSLTWCEEADDDGRGFLLENPFNSYGFLFPRAQRLKKRPGIRFLKCYNCMMGGARFKISGLLTNLDLADQFDTAVCVNRSGICSRTGLPHLSIRPVVQDSEVVAFPTEEEAEYPLGLCNAIALGVSRYLQKHPTLAKTCVYDFVEVFSGPNAPTTAAVVRALDAVPDLSQLPCFPCSSWFCEDENGDSEEEELE